MRVLGIDLGDKRTGLALADRELDVVSPLWTVEIPIAREDELIEKIKTALAEQNGDEVVMGLPLNMDDSEGSQAKKVRAFATRLSQAVAPIPVHLHDERLTSEDADALMAQSGLTHKQKKARRDALAACAILRSFLSSPGGE